MSAFLTRSLKWLSFIEMTDFTTANEANHTKRNIQEYATHTRHKLDNMCIGDF